MNESFMTSIGENQLPVRVYFDYVAAEKRTHDEPGYAASAEINEILVKVEGGERCISDIVPEGIIDLLEHRAIEYVEDQIAMSKGE